MKRNTTTGEEIVNPHDVAARWLYIRRQKIILSSAYAASRKAAARLDWIGQARLLKVAMKASTGVAAAYGVHAKATDANRRDDEAIEAAMSLIERTRHLIDVDASEDRASK